MDLSSQKFPGGKPDQIQHQDLIRNSVVDSTNHQSPQNALIPHRVKIYLYCPSMFVIETNNIVTNDVQTSIELEPKS